MPIVVFGVLIAIWEVLSDAGTISKIVLPAPSAIADSFGNELGNSEFYPDLIATMEEMAIGSAIGMAVGFLGGVVVAISPIGRSLVQPVMIALQAVPGLVLAPLMLIWFGYGLNSKIALVVLSTFFPLFVTTVQGIRSTPGEYLSLMEAMQSKPLRTLLTVRIPYAAPLIFAGIKAAIPTAFSAAVVSEFIGATKGLGLRVLSYNESLQIPEVFALVLIMVIIGVFLYYATELLDRRLIFWRGRS
ncbi:ABC transporter permease [Conexibacter sp. CPCC 206217]|uniref:ABC transporter permease n=1 Tax=Conexibacter sp. CPCC 206217 TaxID=3064574 RepID=UPI0027256C4C|nr:ABC transporter permease [Conexibacter sp. CPCC 206217]MDO8211711.1 ABC transporter permease [Conexibacter sp. CPCC 206217]